MNTVACSKPGCDNDAVLAVNTPGHEVTGACDDHLDQLAAEMGSGSAAYLIVGAPARPITPWDIAWMEVCAKVPCPSEEHFRMLLWSYLGLSADDIDEEVEERIGDRSIYKGAAFLKDTPWAVDLLDRSKALLIERPPTALMLRQRVIVGVEDEGAYRAACREVLGMDEDDVDAAVFEAVEPVDSDRAAQIVNGLAAYLPTLPNQPLPIQDLTAALRLHAQNRSVPYVTQALARAVRGLLLFAPKMPTVWETAMLTAQGQLAREGRKEEAARLGESLAQGRVVDEAGFRRAMEPLFGREDVLHRVASVRAPLRNQVAEPVFSLREMIAARCETEALREEVETLRSHVRTLRDEDTQMRKTLDKTAGHLRKLRQVRDRAPYPIQVIAGALEGLGYPSVSAMTGAWVAALAQLLDRDTDPTEAFQAAFRETFAAERARLVRVASQWTREGSTVQRDALLAAMDRAPLRLTAPYEEQILYCFGSRAAQRDMTLEQVIEEVAPADRAAFDKAWESLVREERLVLYGSMFGSGRYGYPPSTEHVREVIREMFPTKGPMRERGPVPLRIVRGNVDRRLATTLSDKAFTHALYPMLGTGEFSLGYLDPETLAVVRGPWPTALGHKAPLPMAGPERATVTAPEPIGESVAAPEKVEVTTERLGKDWLAQIPHKNQIGKSDTLVAFVGTDGHVVLYWGTLNIAKGSWDFASQSFAGWTISEGCPLLFPGETTWPDAVQASLEELRKALAAEIPSAPKPSTRLAELPAPVPPPVIPSRDRAPMGTPREELIAVAAEGADEWFARYPYPDPAGVYHPLLVVVSKTGEVTVTWGGLLVATATWFFARRDFGDWKIPSATCPLLPPGETMWPGPVHAAFEELRKALMTVIPAGTMAASIAAVPSTPARPWNPAKAKGFLLMESGRAFVEGSAAVAEAWVKAHNIGAWQSEEAFRAAFQAIGPAEHTIEQAIAKIRG